MIKSHLSKSIHKLSEKRRINCVKCRFEQSITRKRGCISLAESSPSQLPTYKGSTVLRSTLYTFSN